MSQYIEFHLLRDTGKTKVYAVDSSKSGLQIAMIKWYGPWRQYAFFPETETIWNPECLEGINRFIRDLMIERRKSKAGVNEKT